jgi:cell division septation protein DedD
MNVKDDEKEEKEDSLSDSKELFDRIFKEATQEIKLEKRGTKQSPDVVSAPAPGRSQHQTKTSETVKSAAKPAGPTSRKPKTAQTSPKPKSERAESSFPPKSTPKTDKKKVKRSRTLRARALLILLAILAVIVSNFMGIIDVSLLLNYFKSGRELATKAPIPTKQPVKLSEKAVASPKQQQEQAPTPSPAPSEPTPSAISKEEELAEIETPTTIPQAKADKERVEEKASSVPTTEQPKPPDIAARQEHHPVPVRSQASAKPGVPEVAPSRPRTPQYPYSVYLGSFKTSEAVNKALIAYQEKGLSAYWAKVDLGDKGVWFRFFTGHFQTKEEAEKFIRERNIQGATPGITRYANLIGIFSSDKEFEDQRSVVVSAGFYPYVIQGADGLRLLFSGAFDRKEYAEKEQTVLASKGIRSEIVER